MDDLRAFATANARLQAAGVGAGFLATVPAPDMDGALSVEYRQPVGPTLADLLCAAAKLPPHARADLLAALKTNFGDTTNGLHTCPVHGCAYAARTCPACDWQKRAESAEAEVRALTARVERYEDAERDREAAHHAMTGE